MVHFRVFLGAPSLDDTADVSKYQWHNVSSTQPPAPPAATFEAASRRISKIYENIIFRDDDEDESLDEIPLDITNANVEINQTTVITWAPTPSQDNNQTKSRFQESTWEETQESGSYNYSDSSSIARFPQFHFNLLSLSSIPALSKMVASARSKGSMKVNVLVAVLEVDGPDTITLKKGREAGKQVSLLKMILGDEEGNVSKLTAWREIADLWGNDSPAIRRGDVVYFQDLLLVWEPPTTPTLTFTASPNLKPKAEICYRTMAYSPEDNRLRPDLRLGYSDAAVRRVGSVVSWFEKMAGL